MSNQALQTQPAKPATPAKASALQIMAARMNVDPAKLHETLKQTVFAKATNEELLALTVVANEYDLNPFLKEIYAFPAKGGGIVPIVSVDGWNKMLIRQPNFDGIEFSFEHDGEGKPTTCTATIHIKGRSKPCVVTEYFDECFRPTDPWKNMPHRMFRNRTLCQASRMAFGFSGIYHEEEAIDISAEVRPDPVGQITDKPAAKKEQPATPPPAIKGTDRTPNEELETLLVTNGHTFPQFIKWATVNNILEDASSFADFGQLPLDFCRRMLRASGGLLKGLADQKSAAQ